MSLDIDEAVAFYKQVSEDKDVDPASPLTWNYILGPLELSQVDR
jgi:hypothetical protein